MRKFLVTFIPTGESGEVTVRGGCIQAVAARLKEMKVRARGAKDGIVFATAKDLKKYASMRNWLVEPLDDTEELWMSLRTASRLAGEGEQAIAGGNLAEGRERAEAAGALCAKVARKLKDR